MRVFTEEHRRNLSIARRRNRGGFVGKHHSPELVERLRLINTGKTFKHTEETKRKISETRKALKIKRPDVAERNRTHTGPNSPHWKGGKKKDKSMYWSRRRVRKLNAEGSHTFLEWQALKKKYNYMCLCCKRQEPFIKLTRDHIMPLSIGGSDYITNIQPLCGSCNSRKNVKTVNYRLEEGVHNF